MAFRGDDNPTTAGLGPGGGPVPGIPDCCNRNGNGAGYGTTGFNWNGSAANNTYGSVFLLPLVGGSGGSSGTSLGSRGGGVGGGALLIAGSVSITVNGVIRADGGEARAFNPSICSKFNGGGGSGGAIRLMAPVIDGTGTLSALGGNGTTCTNSSRSDGGLGRIRYDTNENNFIGTFTGVVGKFWLSPSPGFLVLSRKLGLVRVVAMDAIAVPDQASGSLSPVDITINTPFAVTLSIEARNIPLGTVEAPTVITLLLVVDGGPDQVVETTPLSGTFELSTATATVTFPMGFTRFMPRALWTP